MIIILLYLSGGGNCGSTVQIVLNHVRSQGSSLEIHVEILSSLTTKCCLRFGGPFYGEAESPQRTQKQADTHREPDIHRAHVREQLGDLINLNITSRYRSSVCVCVCLITLLVRSVQPSFH